MLIRCDNREYTVILRNYLFGQIRIQLCKGPNKDIVRECCTYSPHKAGLIAQCLKMEDNPEAFLKSMEKSWNCEGPGLRIRLDAEPVRKI